MRQLGVDAVKLIAWSIAVLLAVVVLGIIVGMWLNSRPPHRR